MGKRTKDLALEQREKRRAYMREYMREYAKKNPAWPEYVRAWNDEHKSERAEARRLDYLENRVEILAAQKVKNSTPEARAKRNAWLRSRPGYGRGWRLQMLYGITLEAWDELFEKQGRVCALCGTDSPGSRGWNTDHDHVTHLVRGILCANCNTTLGRMGDEADKVRAFAERALRYLEGQKLNAALNPALTPDDDDA